MENYIISWRGRRGGGAGLLTVHTAAGTAVILGIESENLNLLFQILQLAIFRNAIVLVQTKALTITIVNPK